MNRTRGQHKTIRPLLAVWLFVFAVLLQPAVLATWTTSSCDASGDCCCSEEPLEASSCCSTPAPRSHGPAYDRNECGCQMDNQVPVQAPRCTLQEAAHDDGFDLADRALAPLPESLVGTDLLRCATTAPEAHPPDRGNSLLLRRLRSGGLREHLARLAVARL